MAYNMLTCSGFGEDATGFVASMPCMKSRVGIIILFFVIAILRRWGGEEMGVGFNFVFALLLGIVPYFLIMTIFGNLTWAMGAGVLGALLGGYGAGLVFGEDGGGY